MPQASHFLADMQIVVKNGNSIPLPGKICLPTLTTFLPAGFFSKTLLVNVVWDHGIHVHQDLLFPGDSVHCREQDHSAVFLQLFQACQVVLAHNIILFQGVVPVNHHHRLFQALGGTAMGGAALGLFQILGLGLFQVLGRLALLFLPSFSKVAVGFSKPEEELAAAGVSTAFLGWPLLPLCLAPPALGSSEVESCSNFLVTACFCLFQGFQVLGQDSGVSWVCLFQGWPLHPLPSFLPGLGSGPMTKLPPLFVGGPFRLVHLFQGFPVQGGFSNPLSFSKPSLRDQAFPNPKPCFSSRAFPSPPTATSYKWCCSCMCWLWSLVTKLCYSGCCFLADFCCWWTCMPVQVVCCAGQVVCVCM